jgi:hypothetical protein
LFLSEPQRLHAATNQSFPKPASRAPHAGVRSPGIFIVFQDAGQACQCARRVQSTAITVSELKVFTSFLPLWSFFHRLQSTQIPGPAHSFAGLVIAVTVCCRKPQRVFAIEILVICKTATQHQKYALFF